MELKKRKIEKEIKEEESGFNMGIATLERIDTCFKDLKQFIRIGQIQGAILEVRELLSEVHKLLPKEEREQVDEFTQEINDNYVIRPSFKAHHTKNQECFEKIYEIQKLVKGVLWDKGFTMPKKDDIMSKPGM